MNDAHAMMTYDAHKKSLGVTFLLWWFLGVFGAHRFYLGRTGSAMMMLLLFLFSLALTLVFVGFVGLLAVSVWWLVDAFLISGMVREHNVRLAGQILR